MTCHAPMLELCQECLVYWELPSDKNGYIWALDCIIFVGLHTPHVSPFITQRGLAFLDLWLALTKSETGLGSSTHYFVARFDWNLAHPELGFQRVSIAMNSIDTHPESGTFLLYHQGYPKVSTMAWDDQEGYDTDGAWDWSWVPLFHARHPCRKWKFILFDIS